MSQSESINEIQTPADLAEPLPHEIMTEARVLRRDELASHIRNAVDSLQNLSDGECQRLASIMKFETFSPGSVIAKQGTISDKYFIISSGTVELVVLENQGKRGMTVCKLSIGDAFGDSALLESNKKRKCSVVVENAAEVNCFTITASDFSAILEPPEIAKFAARLDPPDQNIELVKFHAETIARVIPKEGLKEVGLLGTGCSGRVTLVSYDPQDGEGIQYFALKQIKKSTLEESVDQRTIERELRMLKSINHPFIVKLFCDYDEVDYMYLLQEFVVGGELFTLIQNSGGLGSKDARFYGAILSRCLGHIHDRKIIYRDLKPENVLIDKQGYAKLIDFGLSKRLGSDDKTMTLCGTVEYVAPEMIRGEGYSHQIDWWAFGILLYEIVCGRTPFQSNSGNNFDVYTNIQNGRIRFMRKFESEDKNLIKKLLVADPLRRLSNAEEIQASIALQIYGIEKLEKFGCKAPWVPDVYDEVDTRWFKGSSDPILTSVENRQTSDLGSRI